MKAGVTTSEFGLAIVSMVLGIVKNYWLPDFPSEAFYVVIAYIVGRVVVKAVNGTK